MDLSGTWRFCPDPFDDGEAAGWQLPDFDDSAWGTCELPCVFDRLAPSLASYEGPIWFRRTVQSNACREWPELAIGAANYRASVWWNGAMVSESADPFLPIVVPLREHLRNGSPDVVVIRVDNARRVGEVPGKQRGWRPFGGVLRGMEVNGKGLVHIEAAHIEAAADGAYRIVSRIVNHSHNTATIHLSVRITRTSRLGEVSADSSRDIDEWAQFIKRWRQAQRDSAIPPDPDNVMELAPQESREVVLTGVMDRPYLWAPDAPNRYDAVLWLNRHTRQNSVNLPWHTVDTARLHFGFRTVAIEDGRITLNGKPIFVRGFNRHEDSPSRDMAVDPELARADLVAMKEAGANFVRLCHYPHDPSSLELCDELGLLAMCEIPLYWWGDVDEDHAVKLDAAKRQLTKLIERDRSHPSVIFWSVSNETADGNPIVAEGNRELVRLAKALDPTRLAVHVSDKWKKSPNFDADDVLCVNNYPTWGSRLTGKPQRTWREELAALRERWPDKPIVITEFGYTGFAGVVDGSSGERAQAAAIEAEWKDFTRADGVCGAVLWCWADHAWPEDDWHRRVTISPFGAVARDRTPKLALETVTRCFTGKPQLHMKRDTLGNLPPLDDPGPEYRLRVASPDDLPALGLLLRGAFPEVEFSDERVRQWLFEDPTVATVHVVEHLATGALAATASERLVPSLFPGAGYLHWVGSDPAHRGRALGRLCTLAVLHGFRERGCDHAVLETDDFRLPAIRLYRTLDFYPVNRHASHAERWAALSP